MLEIHSAVESAGSEAPVPLKVVLVKTPPLLLFMGPRLIISSHPSTNQVPPCLVVSDELKIRCTQGSMARDLIAFLLVIWKVIVLQVSGIDLRIL